MKTIYIITGIVLLATLNACNSLSEKKSEDQQTEMKMPIDMETILLDKTNPEIPIKLPGELVADKEVYIHAKIPSYVKTLKVDVGSQVQEGQILMILEAPEINSQLSSANAKLKAQEANYIATKSTYDRTLRAAQTEGAVSQDAIDQITARKDADEAQLMAARSAYNEIKAMENYLVIRAPFNGIITERNTDLGSFVGKGMDKPLLVLQNSRSLRLELAIPESHTSYVNLGDTITFTVKSIPQKSFYGIVSRKSGALDTKLRTEHIEADIQNINKELLSRMVVDASIKLKALDSSFFIPKTALVESNMGIYIMQVVNGKTKKTSVRKGRMNGMLIEIFGEINNGDAIILKVSEEIKEGIDISKK